MNLSDHQCELLNELHQFESSAIGRIFRRALLLDSRQFSTARALQRVGLVDLRKRFCSLTTAGRALADKLMGERCTKQR